MTETRILVGDCIEVMRLGTPESIDAIVTDPPYGLGFMGKEWDALPPGKEWAEECFRVLKPGGHLLAFGGTRTYHRLAVAVEDAGFEIRDCLAWMYGQGFPKSQNVSKMIDKAAGADREVIGSKLGQPGYSLAENDNGTHGRTAYGKYTDAEAECAITAPATPEAEQWDGWGTALKPAFEPIVLARKPFKGTVVKNVLEHGTGAINIDGCRIGTNSTQGRWPANVLLDEEAAAMLDEQTENVLHGAGKARAADEGTHAGVRTEGWGNMGAPAPRFGDSGGASRFFYCAKASKRERNAGLDHLPQVLPAFGNDKGDGLGRGISDTRQDIPRANFHPTVKPIDVMRWLVRLVAPPGGRVLDPFMGSGTTGIACVLEGFNFVGIELDPEYAEIASARVAHWKEEEAVVEQQ